MSRERSAATEVRRLRRALRSARAAMKSTRHALIIFPASTKDAAELLEDSIGSLDIALAPKRRRKVKP